VSEDYTELIERSLGVFNEQGPQGWVDFLSGKEMLHPEFAFHIQEDLPNGGEWRGVDGFMEMARLWNEAWKEFTVVPQGTTVGPDGQLFMEVEQQVVARGSGMEIASGFFYVIVFRDGKIAEGHLFNDRQQAARTAGLSG
jgi:ketosteroid isomerase-like protein